MLYSRYSMNKIIEMKSLVGTLLFLLTLVLGGCTSIPSLTHATGIPYEVVVTMDESLWNSPAGKLIKEDLTHPMQGLPHAESTMRMTYVNPRNFNGLIKYVRNLVVVKVDPTVYTKTSIRFEADRWASDQVLLSVLSPSRDSIVGYFDKHPYLLSRVFNEKEIERKVTYLNKNFSPLVFRHVRDKFGISLKVPSDISYCKDTTDFFWASNLANKGRTDIVVYTFPYTDVKQLTKEALLAKRDSVMKAHISGSFPGSYMCTERRAPLYFQVTNKENKYVVEMRGLFKVEGDMMGGPFVNLTQIDRQNNRIVVAEGFVFAPETDKRNYIRRAEAALHTLLLPGEWKDKGEKGLKK